MRIEVDILTGLNKDREQIAWKVSEDKIQLKVLEREVKKLSGVTDGLASKADEVQLTGLATEEASRSGVQMLYKAGPNPQKVGPARITIAGGFFLCLWGRITASQFFLRLLSPSPM